MQASLENSLRFIQKYTKMLLKSKTVWYENSIWNVEMIKLTTHDSWLSNVFFIFHLVCQTKQSNLKSKLHFNPFSDNERLSKYASKFLSMKVFEYFFDGSNGLVVREEEFCMKTSFHAIRIQLTFDVECVNQMVCFSNLRKNYVLCSTWRLKLLKFSLQKFKINVYLLK